MNVIGHDREASDRLDAIPRLVKGLDDIDEQPRNRIGLKIMTLLVADHPRKFGKTVGALDRDHIEIRSRIVKTSQPNAHLSFFSLSQQKPCASPLRPALPQWRPPVRVL